MRRGKGWWKGDGERCEVGLFFFFFNDTATTEIYTLSLHDALPICLGTEGSNGSLFRNGWFQCFLV